MDVSAHQLELRNAIAMSDELGRYDDAFDGRLDAHLATVRTTLGDLERAVGHSHDAAIPPRPALLSRLETSTRAIRDHVEEAPLELRPRLRTLLASLERILFAERRPSTPLPAKPVLGGVLPLRRLVPQGAHSIGDYVAALALLVSASLARTRRARAAGLVLGAKLGAAALLTDTRMAAARWIPIELHELVDHGVGFGAVVAPSLLGYRRRDRVVATIQTLAGLTTMALSLLTDYRAEEGLARPMRSRGGPRAQWRRRRRVPEVQRPLEGLASPSVLPRVRV